MSDPGVSGRRGGKATFIRMATEAAAKAGQHVHYGAHDGSVWGLTCQPVGFLWVRVRKPGWPDDAR